MAAARFRIVVDFSTTKLLRRGPASSNSRMQPLPHSDRTQMRFEPTRQQDRRNAHRYTILRDHMVRAQQDHSFQCEDRGDAGDQNVFQSSNGRN